MARIVCVDDEKQALSGIVSVCEGIGGVTEVKGFDRPKAALKHLADYPCDIALLDIRMPEMDGISLARKILDLHPETENVFITAHERYAVDAWSVHARGYLLKPLAESRLREEIGYILSLHPEFAPAPQAAPIEVRTFGNFDVLVNGEPVRFQRAKAKELLAFLVEKQGRAITREEAFHILWEDKPYDRPGQKQLDVILRSLRFTLEEYGISGILSVQRGAICIHPRMIRCDMYRFVSGDVAAMNEYRGEYMNAYSWASLREAYLERRIEAL